jgi:hypothetical protein
MIGNLGVTAEGRCRVKDARRARSAALARSRGPGSTPYSGATSQNGWGSTLSPPRVAHGERGPAVGSGRASGCDAVRQVPFLLGRERGDYHGTHDLVKEEGETCSWSKPLTCGAIRLLYTAFPRGSGPGWNRQGNAPARVQGPCPIGMKDAWAPTERAA